MIKKIEFVNYKAFDKGCFELKPITILLGANSSGKSSLLQLLMMFKQTVNIEGSYESALKLNGKYIGLGDTDNIFKNRNIDKPIIFSFGIESNRNNPQSNELIRLKRNIESEIFDIYFQLIKLEQLTVSSSNEYDRIRKIRYKEEISIEDISFIIKEIKKYKRKYHSEEIIQPTLFEDEFIDNKKQKNNLYFEKNIQRILQFDIDDYNDTYMLLSTIVNFNPKKFDIEYEISYSKKNKNLVVTRIAIKDKDTILLEYHVQKIQGHTKYILKSSVINNRILEKYRVKFGKNVKFDSLILKPKVEDSVDSTRFRRFGIENDIFCTTVIRLFNYYTSRLYYEFNSARINYISPLRAFPKRYYFLDESNVSSSLDSIDGDNLTETLKKESNVIAKVNKWLNTFGLSVSVEDVKEVIHRLKVNQNGISLDITDVGFGISQVLPIIVQGFLSKDDSLTIIEQPEIHLHPMMQAELADLFIDVVNNNNPHKEKTLLIETHSESILKRLRRRIAEGKIKNSDVAIYFVHGRKKKSESAILERIEIGEKGSFDWPKEFYSTDFEDTNEFLKHQ
jgi:predicted ATPase